MCQYKLHKCIDEELKGCRTESQIKKAITKAFDRAEKDWIEVAKVGFFNGYPKTAYVGACALVAVIIDNKAYIANSGDCKAVLLRKDGESSY